MGDSPKTGAAKRPAVQRGVSTVSGKAPTPLRPVQRGPSSASTVQRAVSTVSSRSGGKERPLSGGELQWQGSVHSGQPAEPIPPTVGKRILNCLSHAVVILFLAVYSLAGGVFFVYLERPHEEAVQRDTRAAVNASREFFIGRIWNYTKENVIKTCNVTDLLVAEASVRAALAYQLHAYEEVIYGAADEGVYVHDEPDYNWNYPRAMFFSATVITTIGYGNIAPVTTGGRVFCIVYAFLGIPLTLIAIGDMGKLFAEFVKFVYKKIKKQMAANRKRRAEAAAAAAAANPTAASHHQQQHNGSAPVPGPEADSDADVAKGPSKTLTSLRVLGAMALLVLYIAFGGGLFILWERWTFFESFYFCFITMTTIGLGDVVPEHQMFMLLCTVYILIGLALTSTCIELARSEYEKSWQRMMEASKRLHGINLADTLRRIGDQIEMHGEIVDLNLLADLKSAITGVHHEAEDEDKPPPLVIYETSV